MSELNEMGGHSGPEAEFTKLLESNGTIDPGIELFEQKIKEAEDRISKYIDLESIELTRALADQEIDSLNDSWLYHYQPVTFTGRIHLVNVDERQSIPKAWGEPEDGSEHGSVWYVEDEPLQSLGVDIDFTTSEESDEEIGSARIAYALSLPGDIENTAIFKAYPDEIAKQEYPFPTPAGVQVKLSMNWPDHYELIENLIHDDIQSALPTRIAMLVRRMKNDLKSEQFRDIVGIHINEKLNLDKQLPYLLTVSNNVLIYDGDNPYDPSEEGNWLSVNVDEPFSILAYRPKLFFNDHEDGPLAILSAETYNKEYGDEAEYISVLIENVQDLKSTRSLRSLASVAFMRSEDQFIKAISAGAGDFPASAASGVAENINPVAVKANLPIGSREPAILSRMKLIETTLGFIAKQTRMLQSAVYDTEHKAFMACEEFVKEIKPVFDLLGLGPADLFRFSGDTIMKPVVKVQPSGSESNINMIAVGVNEAEPYTNMQNGDSIVGLMNAVMAHTRPVLSSEGVIAGYTINPVALVDQVDDTKALLRLRGVSTVNVTVSRRAVVPLDGSADLELRSLERYRNTMDSLKQARVKYGNSSSLVKQLKQLHNILLTESVNDIVSLKKPKILSKINKSLVDVVANGAPSASALSALEDMLIDRGVAIMGEAYVAKDGNLLPVVSENDYHIKGRVLDIQLNTTHDELMMVVSSISGQILHIPFSSINDFRF